MSFKCLEAIIYLCVCLLNWSETHFVQLTPEDDPDLEEPETLEDKKNDLANAIKNIVPGIEKHHFIKRYENPEDINNLIEIAPKILLLMFKTLDDAQDFVNAGNIQFDNGAPPILARNKRLS